MTLEETHSAALWMTAGHPKTLQNFSTQGNGLGLMFPLSGVPVFTHQPSCVRFSITSVANMLGSCYLLTAWLMLGTPSALFNFQNNSMR